jgi:hypothetical protein
VTLFVTEIGAGNPWLLKTTDILVRGTPYRPRDAVGATVYVVGEPPLLAAFVVAVWANHPRRYRPEGAKGSTNCQSLFALARFSWTWNKEVGDRAIGEVITSENSKSDKTRRSSEADRIKLLKRSKNVR